MHIPAHPPPHLTPPHPRKFQRHRLRSHRSFLPLYPLSSADGAFNAALLLERGDPLSAIASAAGLPMFQEHRYRPPSPSHLPLQHSVGAGAGARAGVGAANATTTAPPPPPPPAAAAAGSIRTNSRNLRSVPAALESTEDATGLSSQHHIDGGGGGGGDQQFDPDFIGSDRREEQASGIIFDQVLRHGEDNDREPPPSGGDRYGRHSSGGTSRKTGAIQEQQQQQQLEQPTGATGGGNQGLWGSRPLALQMFQRAAELGHPEAMREVHRLRLRERMDNLARPGRRR